MLILRRAVCAVKEKKPRHGANEPSGPQQKVKASPRRPSYSQVDAHPFAELRRFPSQTFDLQWCTAEVPESIGLSDPSASQPADSAVMSPLLGFAAAPDTPDTGLLTARGDEGSFNTALSNSAGLMCVSPESSTCSNPCSPPLAPLPSPAMPSAKPSKLNLQACTRLLSELDRIDQALASFDPAKQCAAPVIDLSPGDKTLLLLAYNHMLSGYDSVKWCVRDNEYRHGSGHQFPRAGAPIPNYYANVQDQTIHRRKVLSIAGLRNLVLVGPAIFDELRAALFSGDPDAYAPRTGVHKMRYYTGNAVDLDTTVLRTNDLATLAAVNAMNQKARESSGKRGKAPAVYENSKQFAASAQAGEIARHAASDLLARFAADFGLTKADVLRRAVDHTNLKHIPVARSNADRGKHPLWRYRNAGQDSFHANVPHLDDVIGALLKAPLHAARVYIRIHVLFGSDPEELDRRLDAFYTDCIADACFNQKWRAVEDFERSMSHEGRIVGVLERLQKENQRDFFRIMDDDDDECTREREHMWALACGRSGRDSAGRIRAVTRADVDAWVADPAAVI